MLYHKVLHSPVFCSFRLSSVAESQIGRIVLDALLSLLDISAFFIKDTKFIIAAAISRIYRQNSSSFS